MTAKGRGLDRPAPVFTEEFEHADFPGHYIIVKSAGDTILSVEVIGTNHEWRRALAAFVASALGVTIEDLLK